MRALAVSSSLTALAPAFSGVSAVVGTGTLAASAWPTATDPTSPGRVPLPRRYSPRRRRRCGQDRPRRRRTRRWRCVDEPGYLAASASLTVLALEFPRRAPPPRPHRPQRRGGRDRKEPTFRFVVAHTSSAGVARTPHLQRRRRRRRRCGRYGPRCRVGVARGVGEGVAGTGRSPLPRRRRPRRRRRRGRDGPPPLPRRRLPRRWRRRRRDETSPLAASASPTAFAPAFPGLALLLRRHRHSGGAGVAGTGPLAGPASPTAAALARSGRAHLVACNAI